MRHSALVGSSIWVIAMLGASAAYCQPAQDTARTADAAASSQEKSAQTASLQTGASTTPLADQGSDIIVTATRRAQNLREVPASISAVGSAALQQRAIVNFYDLNASVPGLQISPVNTDISIVLRGVGHSLVSPSAENSVALHLDGVYLSRPVSAQVAFFDVSRVEVLRGPQGSLYGRNATGGAVNVISNGPTDHVTGFASASYSNYDRVDFEGAVGGPIAGSALTGRVGAFYHRRNHGFGTNLVDGRDVDDLDEYGGKAAIRAEIGDDFNLTLRGDYYHASDGFGTFHAFGPVRQPFPGALPLAELLGGTTAADVRDINFDGSNHRRANIWGVSGEANWKLTGRLSLKSITAYRKVKSFFITDVDGTQLPIFSPFTYYAASQQFSQELTLKWTAGNIDALLGGYYFRERVPSSLLINSYLASGISSFGIPRILPVPFGVFDQRGRVRTEAEAAFANVEWKASIKLTFVVGMRYSHEVKTNRGSEIAFFPDFADYPTTGYDTVDDSRGSSGATPSFSVKYALTSDVNVYASVSRGFKSGEWISGTNQYARPERVWAYEAGLKGALFDRRLNFSFAGFYYDYTDLQVQRVQTPITILENAPGGKLKGFEGEFSARLPAGFQFDGNFTYLDTKIKGFITQNPNFAGNPTQDLTGNRFAFAPKFSFNLSLEKHFSLLGSKAGVIRFDYQHTSPTFLDIFNSTANDYRKAYAVINASYRQELVKGLSILFWGKNLTNRTVPLYQTENLIPNLIVRNGGVPVPVASTAVGLLNEPRTYGATLRIDF